MRWHVREGYLQYLHTLDADADECKEDGDGYSSTNFAEEALPCELASDTQPYRPFYIQTTLVHCVVI